MHFLALHGQGTNSQIFEMQSAAIRYELGDGHTFDFVEGTIPTEVAPEIRNMAGPGDTSSRFFMYADFNDLTTCVRALDYLDAYVEAEGPFDGIIAFSQGATLAATWLARRVRKKPATCFSDSTFGLVNVEDPNSLGLRCAIFFSGGGAYDPDLLSRGQLRLMTPDTDGEVIKIPTAHIWGRNDKVIVNGGSYIFSTACASSTRQVYVHEGDHEIPGSRSPADVKAIVRLVRRVVSTAAYNSEYEP